MQALINLKVKFREGFRPFAPSVLGDRAKEYFDLEGESPYMLVVAPVKEQRRLPMPERYDVSEAARAAVMRAKASGGRVVAVGTTVWRLPRATGGFLAAESRLQSQRSRRQLGWYLVLPPSNAAS